LWYTSKDIVQDNDEGDIEPQQIDYLDTTARLLQAGTYIDYPTYNSFGTLMDDVNVKLHSEPLRGTLLWSCVEADEFTAIYKHMDPKC